MKKLISSILLCALLLSVLVCSANAETTAKEVEEMLKNPHDPGMIVVFFEESTEKDVAVTILEDVGISTDFENKTAYPYGADFESKTGIWLSVFVGEDRLADTLLALLNHAGVKNAHPDYLLPIDDEPLSGDLNENGKLDPVDCLILRSALLRATTLTDKQKELADLNGDDGVSPVDYLLLKSLILHS